MKIHGRILFAVLLGCAIALQSNAAENQEAEAVPGEYVVKLRSEHSVARASVQALSRALQATVKSAIPEGNLVVVQRPTFELREAAIKRLNQNPLVEYAEPNFIYRINRTPNDPLFSRLWGMAGGFGISAEKAWDIETGSENVVIAVIDTGVDYNHPDLRDNIWINAAEKNGQTGIDDDGNGFVDDIYGMNFTNPQSPSPNGLDDHGHGTHCAGVIGARGDDGRGIVGVNWNVRIMPIKFLGADGGGSLEGAIKAIDYATLMGAKITSNSWGGGGFSQSLKEAIDRAHAAGSLFVAAAGNDGSNNDSSPTYPSSYPVPNILSVAAIDNKGGLAGFSNYGKRSVHVGAPGVDIFSAVVGGKYSNMSGTSMATPHVSGIAGLLAAQNPSMTALEIKERIVSTVESGANLKGKTRSGGFANAHNALTNKVAAPDLNDPVYWQTTPVMVSTAHPYGRKVTENYTVSVPGAKEIAIYFEKFETERGYDKVTIYDAGGNKISVMTGNNDDSFSAVIPGESARIELTTDDSVEKYGFDITKVAYR